MSRVLPLSTSTSLTHIAEQRVEYLCTHEFSHDGWYKFPSNFSYRGENLARGYPDATSTHQALMNSPSHKKNIVSKNYTHIGIAQKCGITVEEFGGYSD